MSLVKLTAVRSHEVVRYSPSGIRVKMKVTTFLKSDGSHFATFPWTSRQPAWGSKRITINRWKWDIEKWILKTD